MAEFELYRGVGHPLSFRGQSGEVRDMGPLTQVPRAESKERPIGPQMLEVGGLNVPVPVYEVSYGRIDSRSARQIGGLAANELVVVSRLTERGAKMARVAGGYAHPAYMERNGGRRIVRARYAAIPEAVGSSGSSAKIDSKRDISGARRLINCLPEDMYLQVGGGHVTVDRDRQPWIDVRYKYRELGHSEEGITVASSAVQDVGPLPSEFDDQTLVLAHTEAVLEAARTGVDPELVSQMVFPVGLQRTPNGQQGNVFTGIGYYSANTLKRYLNEVRI